MLMEKYLSDIDVWCWRYPDHGRNYPGLHFTARPEACDALSRCLHQLRDSSIDSSRSLPLRSLSSEDEALVSGGHPFESFSKLRLSVQTESAELRQMSFRVTDGLITFDFTRHHLFRFERGLTDVRAGRGDYSIIASSELPTGHLDANSECLWFWPCFGHYSIAE